MWKCLTCKDERKEAVKGIVSVYPAKHKIAQPCVCGGEYVLLCECNLPGFDVSNTDICPTCKKSHRL